MRLIDAETLNKELNDLPYGIRGIIKTMVHKQPAIDIVECKDCKYWDYEVDNDVGFCVRTEDCDWNADDFCSRGVKR